MKLFDNYDNFHISKIQFRSTFACSSTLGNIVIFVKINILIKSKSTLLDHWSMIINHGKKFYINQNNKITLVTILRTIKLYDSTASPIHR